MIRQCEMSVTETAYNFQSPSILPFTHLPWRCLQGGLIIFILLYVYKDDIVNTQSCGEGVVDASKYSRANQCIGQDRSQDSVSLSRFNRT